MAYNRFVSSAVSELQEINCSPINGYQHSSTLTLEEAIEEIKPLVSSIVDYVLKAKENCNRNSALLTWDESAAIYLYSMPVPFYFHLNNALRAKNRHAINPWFAYFKMLLTALEKLPATKGTVWRGVNYDDTLTFVDNDIHIWWGVNSCSMDLRIVQPFLSETGTLFAIEVNHGKDISTFSARSEEQEVILMPGTRVRRRYDSLSFIDRLFIIHLEEVYTQSHVFELIKYEYQRNSLIERIMDPRQSFPIEQNYINLAIVETREQREKEKKLLDAKLNNEIIDTYEEIYGAKTKIEVKDIFERCKDQTKRILIFGRAGIGKTTFCRYVAHQWAIGAVWQEYYLVIFIRLRNLTDSRYPSLANGHRYSLIDLLKTEYFYDSLCDEDEKHLKEYFDTSKILWLLDGYDEIVQNIPEHLKYLFEQLLKTPHHILTSRPYLNTLSYNVQLEITGFTDDNIKKYVKQFFNQIKDQVDNAPLQAQKLLNFLKCNTRMWGIVHIPVNLELICSLWCDTDWSETTTLTMTTVYDKMTEWLCRRHLEKQNICSNLMTKEDVYAHCHKELAFLQSLAFNGMKSNTIILRPKLLQVASKESKYPLQHQTHLLNIGILKSLDYKPIGTRIEVDKNHYFIHFSFQEHFAARYLVEALNNDKEQKKKAIDFIQSHKYNQHFELMLTFASGLLNVKDDEQSINLFWDAVFEEPMDLVGLRHVQLLIFCIEETGCNANSPKFSKSINFIMKWIKYYVFQEQHYRYKHIELSLRRSPSLVNRPEIIETFVMLYQNKDRTIRRSTLALISSLLISNPYFGLIHLHTAALNDKDAEVKKIACRALGQLEEAAVTDEVINGLVTALRDTNDSVRYTACETLAILGAKTATTEVINRLLIVLQDPHDFVRKYASHALVILSEKGATNEVINKLLIILRDATDFVRKSVCETLGLLGEKAATNEVMNELLMGLRDRNDSVRYTACRALGRLGTSAATNNVIVGLLVALRDMNDSVRKNACEALGILGEKAQTTDLINGLSIALQDKNDLVAKSACIALGMLGEKASTKEVINGILVVLQNANDSVRYTTCRTLAKLGEKAATHEVISGLLIALRDKNEFVRKSACETLMILGEKAAINEVVTELLISLRDTNDSVSRIALECLCMIGQKAVTNEVINGLLIALRDTNDSVRHSAAECLGMIGEKAATYDVIYELLITLKDTSDSVRKSACKALSILGNKTATIEVINELLHTLQDTNDFVRQNVCEALGILGKTAATNEVLNGLLIALRDTNDIVRRSAAEGLWMIGEKAATNEVINELLIALQDTNDSVRKGACKALNILGEKSPTSEVVNGLLMALRDKNDSVRFIACGALGRVSGNAATNEILSGLLDALRDTNDSVRHSACRALDRLSEKAATNDIINGFLFALQDMNDFVGKRACQALSRLGEKAATREVIGALLNAWDNDSGIHLEADRAIVKILPLLSCLSDLGHETVWKLSRWINEINREFDKTISSEKLIQAFLKSKSPFWLPIIGKVFISQGYGITVSDNSVKVYDSKEPFEMYVSNRELCQQLQNYFNNWLDESLSDHE